MSWFKSNKTEDTEVCGFLDDEGRFFQYKKDRDESNEKMELERLDEEFKARIRNGLSVRHFPSYEVERAIQTVIEIASSHKVLFPLLRVYIEYNLRREKLKKKYNKL